MTDSLAAAAVLRQVLLEPGPRRLWLRHAIVGPADGINQRAVAAVLAGYLADRGERADTPDLPRQLKDRVYRALSGLSLSAETLRWFIEAFELDPDQEAALFQAWLGPQAADGNPDRPAAPDAAAGGGVGDAGDDDGHRTLHLQEWHRIGPDGVPSVHETVQTIQATAESLEAYLYRFDRREVVVDALHGGQAGPVHPVDDGLHGVRISFPTPLSRGDTATLRYRTRFAFETPPPPDDEDSDSGTTAKTASEDGTASAGDAVAVVVVRCANVQENFVVISVSRHALIVVDCWIVASVPPQAALEA